MHRYLIVAAAVVMALAVDPAIARDKGTPKQLHNSHGRLSNVREVYGGNLVAGDPHVAMDLTGGFRMSYTDADVDPAPTNALIGTAVSPDGINWTPLTTPDTDPGIVVRGRTRNEAVETSALLVTNVNQWLMYVTTYHTPPGDYTIPGYFIPADLYLLVSEDGGATYEWWPDPVIPRAPGWYTNDGIYAPSIIIDDGHFEMAYNAFCYFDCSGIAEEGGGFIMRASSNDGFNWTLAQKPIIAPGGAGGPPWMHGDVKNPSLVKHNGEYLLFFMGDDSANNTAIGMAYAQSMDGPWTIVPEPVLLPEPGTFYDYQVLAPSVIMDDDTVRLWFMAARSGDVFSIGYGEAPLDTLR